MVYNRKKQSHLMVLPVHLKTTTSQIVIAILIRLRQNTNGERVCQRQTSVEFEEWIQMRKPRKIPPKLQALVAKIAAPKLRTVVIDLEKKD